MSKKKILVTGGAGFIGSHLCEELLAHDHEVLCLDNFSTGSHENVAGLPGLQVMEADANAAATWQKLAHDTFDIVFHYAATVGVLTTEEKPIDVLRDTQGLLYLADFARAGHAKKIIFASSSEVYGDTANLPYAETAPALAWSPYTAVKAFGEHVLQTLWHVDHIPTVSLRLFNVYGPRQRGNGYGFVTACFITQALRGESPTVFGDGAQTRDFVNIQDNVRIALAAANQEKAWGEIVNIGTGRETSVLELAEAILEAVNPSHALRPVFLPKRSVEIRRRCADATKMHSLLAATCQVSLAEGIAATVASYAQTAAVTSPDFAAAIAR